MSVFKTLGLIAGIGFTVSQVVGTTSGIMVMKTLEDANESSNIATVHNQNKMMNTLSKAEYSSFLQDSYLLSMDFHNSIEPLESLGLLLDEDKALTDGYDELLKETEGKFVSHYPLTYFAFKNLEKSINSQPSVDKAVLNKYLLLLAAKSSCTTEESILLSAYPEAVRLGEQYFCD